MIEIAQAVRSGAMAYLKRQYKVVAMVFMVLVELLPEAFHEGRRVALPEFYHRVYERRLGRYAELIPIRERIPLRRMRARQAASVASVIAS